MHPIGQAYLNWDQRCDLSSNSCEERSILNQSVADITPTEREKPQPDPLKPVPKLEPPTPIKVTPWFEFEPKTVCK